MAKAAGRRVQGSKTLELRIAQCDIQGIYLKHIREDELLPEKIFFNVKLNLNFDRDSEVARATYDVLGLQRKDDSEPILSLKVSTYFTMSGLKNLPYSEEKIDVPDWAIATMLNISLGITRGVLVAETKGTKYAHLIIPVMDLKDLAPSITRDNDVPGFGI